MNPDDLFEGRCAKVPRHPHRPWLPALAYAALLVYGSLYPWSDWVVPPGGLAALWPELWPKRFSRTDVVTNVAVYVPLGLLALPALRARFSSATALPAVAILGVVLSGLLELGQAFLPQRTSSAADWALNAMGTVLGASAALARRPQRKAR